MRDDLPSLPLSKASKKYARMTSKDLGSDWSKKVDMFMDMVSAETNQSKEGFRNRDAGGKVPHAMKEASQAAIERAAQVWCHDRNKRTEMDVDLALTFAEVLDDVASHGLAEAITRMLLDDEEGIRAAVCVTHRGTVFTGRTHWEACSKAAQAGEKWSDEDLGFLTTKGRVVGRDEAEIIGSKMGQIGKDAMEPGTVHATEFTHYM